MDVMMFGGVGRRDLEAAVSALVNAPVACLCSISFTSFGVTCDCCRTTISLCWKLLELVHTGPECDHR